MEEELEKLLDEFENFVKQNGFEKSNGFIYKGKRVYYRDDTDGIIALICSSSSFGIDAGSFRKTMKPYFVNRIGDIHLMNDKDTFYDEVKKFLKENL